MSDGSALPSDLPPGDLPPPSDTVADRHVHPATAPLRFLKDAPRTILGLPALYGVSSRGGWEGALALAAILAAVTVLFYWVAYRRFRYGVGAHDVVIESGLLTRTRRSIPFDRVQDVDIEQGPLQRLFGLAKVRIETGGSASDEGLIDSVTVAQADALRAAVRAGRAEAASDVDAHAVEALGESPGDRVVFAMTTPRVLLTGLFNFSLVYIAGLFGLLQTFRGLLPFDIRDPGRWLGLLDARLGERVPGGAILAVLLVAGLTGVVFGVLRTLAADYGFRLTAQGRRFRRTRGLFTRSDVVLPKRRVQLATIGAGPLRRRFGWSVLHFQTLSGAGAAGGRQTVAPLATAEEVAAILAEQGRLRLPGDATLQRVSARHIVRTLIGRALVPMLVVAGIAVVYPPASLAVALLPLLILHAYAERRTHGYALTDDLLFVRRGVWRQRLWIVPVEKMQTVVLARGWLQRRLDLATLAVDTAGASAMGGPAIVDLRLERACELADALSVHSGRKLGTER